VKEAPASGEISAAPPVISEWLLLSIQAKKGLEPTS